MIIAIDPGASGGIAIKGSAGVDVFPMPATDGDTIKLIRRYTRMANDSDTPVDKIAYVEELVKHMGAGIPASTMAVYAMNWGIVVGALMMAGWSVELVRPQAWQKALGLGITGRQRSDTKGMSAEEAASEKKRIGKVNADLKREWKNKLKAMAQRLYPHIEPTLKTADALLILRYAEIMETNRLGNGR